MSLYVTAFRHNLPQVQYISAPFEITSEIHRGKNCINVFHPGISGKFKAPWSLLSVSMQTCITSTSKVPWRTFTSGSSKVANLDSVMDEMRRQISRALKLPWMLHDFFPSRIQINLMKDSSSIPENGYHHLLTRKLNWKLLRFWRDSVAIPYTGA